MKYLIIIISMMHSFTVCGQSIYHVDPNNVQMVRTSTIKENIENGSNKIIILNPLNQPFKLLVSADNNHWETVPVAANGKLSYEEKIKYVKIFTSRDQFKFYKLVQGFSYSINWDNVNKLWILQ